MKETCVTTAATIIKSMDTKSDPCTDFYKYACGQWIKSNPVPDGRSTWGMFNELEMNNQLIVKNALGTHHNFTTDDMFSSFDFVEYYLFV